jgi:competence protein ComEC
MEALQLRHLGNTLLLVVLVGCTQPGEAVLPPDDSGPLGRWAQDITESPDVAFAADLGRLTVELIGDTGVDAPPPVYTPPEHFTAVFIDVGQGDAILLQFPEGSTMLVDGGSKSAGWSYVLPYLDELPLTQLDYVVVTHPDADHCGGLDDVVLGVNVLEVWENGQIADTWAWWDFSDAVDDLAIPRITVNRGYDRLIDGCYVQVLNADEGWDDTNGNSVVLQVECEGMRVLLTGDAHAGTQDELAYVYGTDLASDVVKVPHHGSWDRMGEFPDYVTPAIAACSVGANNGYNHPAPEVVEEWELSGATFLRTDESGTITVTLRDGHLAVLTEY